MLQRARERTGVIVMEFTYTSFDQLPLILNADQLAKVLGISRANAYVLLHSKGFPTLRIGKRMVVPKDKFLEWLEHNTST